MGLSRSSCLSQFPKQTTELFPKNLVIYLCGDNSGVIRYAITLEKFTGISAKKQLNSMRHRDNPIALLNQKAY